MIYYPTVMARYSLFVLKVPLNPKQTNKLRVVERYGAKRIMNEFTRSGAFCKSESTTAGSVMLTIIKNN